MELTKVRRCGLAKKLPYSSREVAQFELQSIRIKRLLTHRSGAKMESGVYRCPNCKMWHLTSQKG